MYVGHPSAVAPYSKRSRAHVRVVARAQGEDELPSMVGEIAAVSVVLPRVSTASD